MRKLHFVLILSILTAVLASCSDDEVILNAEEILISKTWIKHSHKTESISDDFIQFMYKDEYTFNSDGTCIIKGIRTFYNEDNELIQDIVEIEDEWSYNEQTNIIDFKINDEPVNTAQFDWEIVRLSVSEIIVRDVFTQQVGIENKILLKAKE